MPLDARDLLHPGDVFGHYRIVRLLGRGGMGEVYEVVHTTLDGRFALKLLQPGIMGVPGVVERFRREARAMHKLKHPHILHVDEFGETEGRVWLRMELADGWPFPDGTRAVSLQEAMRLEAGGISAGEGDETLLPGQLPASRSPGVPSALAREWLRQILEGLVHAHEFPGGAVVHRDVKPANLLFHEGRLKLADFGLVHLAGEEWLHSRLQSSLTMQALRGQPTGADGIPEETLQVGEEPGLGAAAIMGTFEYMPPEGKAGQAGADPRGDLFAVGKIAYQLLTGEREIGFKAPSRLVPGLDRAWDGWVERATEPRPGDRFQSAREMLAALPPAPGSEVDHAAPPGPAAKLPVEPAAEKARDPAEADVFWGRGGVAGGLRWVSGLIALVALGFFVAHLLPAYRGDYSRSAPLLLADAIFLVFPAFFAAALIRRRRAGGTLLPGWALALAGLSLVAYWPLEYFIGARQEWENYQVYGGYFRSLLGHSFDRSSWPADSNSGWDHLEYWFPSYSRVKNLMTLFILGAGAFFSGLLWLDLKARRARRGSRPAH